MTAIVFAGPSIHGLCLDSFRELTMRPPAACGDILRALREGASSIGLIDGLFEFSPAVWHKEILCALAAGIPVYGAASMGALRAAELHYFGMNGIGEIFEQYRSGERCADSDVAVLHAPAEFQYQPLTVAMVDAEATIARLLSVGALDRQRATTLVAAANCLHFKDRTWPAVMREIGLVESDADRLYAVIAEHAFSQKAIDASSLLAQMVKAASSVAPSNAEMKFSLNHTFFLDVLERQL